MFYTKNMYIYFFFSQNNNERIYMGNIKIRDYIINNFKDDDINTLRNTITECITDKDEETLPGMGVFFELIWNGSSEHMKKDMLEILLESLKK